MKIVVLTMMQKEILTFFTTEGRGLHGSEDFAQHDGILIYMRWKTFGL